jgi:hypothetical protein
MTQIARVFGGRTLRLLVVGGLALALAACDKCIVPTWPHGAPAAPQSCHDDAPVR